MQTIRAAAVASCLIFFASCAGPAWQTPISAETHRDVKSYVDFHISTLSQIERRLESADTKEEFIAALEFAGPALSSVDARSQLLIARYPALKSRREPPPPLKEEFERLFRFMKQKSYVIRSLQAGAVRYGSHPSVMQAIEKFMSTLSQGD